MNKLHLNFCREFQLWTYRVGHGELLLRSPKAPGYPTRIDILFKSVQAVELRSRIETLVVEEAQASEVLNRATKPMAFVEKGHKIYLIKSKDWVGLIIAGAVFWAEDLGEYGQPSSLLQDLPPPKD